MLLFLLLIASVCYAREGSTSRSNDLSSHMSGACEHGLEKCGSVTAHCNSRKGKDAAKCLCDATPQSIKW